ncbi:MAG: peptidylprolyl isomerase [Pseudomonadales bacterium]|nr:peptidylprolyl isomerase [Pseudomonadales bacterium]
MATAMAKHILLKNKVDAEKIKQQLLNGEDFSKLAKIFSTCNSGKNGGDLGEIRPGQLVKPVENVIFKKALKTIHGPVKSQFGFHLIQVYYRD